MKYKIMWVYFIPLAHNVLNLVQGVALKWAIIGSCGLRQKNFFKLKRMSFQFKIFIIKSDNS